jgi:hypothetical protein
MRHTTEGNMSERLKLISGNESLVIEPSDGRQTIAQARDVFSYIDSNFGRWGCDVPGQSTEETPVSVYEMAQDATFSELFGDFGVEADCLSLTQSQIKQFAKHHAHWLKTGGNGTFFLFKPGNEFFVAAVFLFSDRRIGVRARRFSLDRIFRSKKQHRLVVPQFTPI